MIVVWISKPESIQSTFPWKYFRLKNNVPYDIRLKIKHFPNWSSINSWFLSVTQLRLLIYIFIVKSKDCTVKAKLLRPLSHSTSGLKGWRPVPSLMAREVDESMIPPSTIILLKPSRLAYTWSGNTSISNNVFDQLPCHYQVYFSSQ